MSHHEHINPREIRLVELLPGEWDSDLEIRTRKVDLDSAQLPFYEILTVTTVAGELLSAATLKCSGQEMRTMSNVVNALRRVRFSTGPRLLWMESIGSGPNSGQEKLQYASLIDTIYQTASRTLVYLGEDDSYGRAGGVMTEILDQNRRMKDAGSFMDLQNFLDSRLWFNNVRSLRELALSKYLLFICSNCCFPMNLLLNYWEKAIAYYGRRERPHATIAYGRDSMQHPSLLQQLHAARGSTASDPCEKIFTALSMFPSEGQELAGRLTSTMAEDVLHYEVAVSILSKDNSLRILSSEQNTQRSGPSWVPNWNSDSNITSLGLFNSIQEPFDAGGSPAIGLSVKGSHLTCMGLQIDDIEQLGGICPRDYQPAIDMLNEWNKLVPEGLDIQNQPEETPGSYWEKYGVYPGTGILRERPINDALWYTIIGKSSPAIEKSLGSYVEGVEKSPRGDFNDLKFNFGRRLLITRTGFLGLAPAEAEPGDVVSVLLGAPVPHVLRRQEDGTYRLVGECYVYGIMDGEALSHLADELSALGHRSRPHAVSKSLSSLEKFTIS